MTGATKFPRPWVVLRQPGQRKRDHGARRREAEWRAYQALWREPIDALECDAERFYDLRRNVLMLNRKQCARLLRCGVQSVLNWETGRHPVPFFAYLALQLVSEAVHYKLANYAWREWRFIERVDTDSRRQYAKRQNNVTELVHPATGAAFTPDQLKRYHALMQQAVAALEANAELHAKVDRLITENTEIRELFRVDGVTDELHAMRERMGALLGKINTAAVVPFKKSERRCAIIKK